MSRDHNRFLFDRLDDEKCRVRFEITLWDKTHELQAEYDNDVAWQEIVNDVIKLIQSSYGYAFDIESNMHEIGIYYPGKEDDG